MLIKQEDVSPSLHSTSSTNAWKYYKEYQYYISENLIIAFLTFI